MVREYLVNNFENIINATQNREMIYLINMVKKLPEGRELLNANKDLIILKFVSGLIPIETIKEEKLENYLTIAINEILEEEGKEVGDIEEYGNGSRTKVYKIGNKIIKTGVSRWDDTVCYHKRILKPLLNVKLCKQNSIGELLHLEITELADIKNISEDEVYLVYKELREDGIIWADAKRTNLGRLIRPNVAYFKGISEVSYKTMGFREEVPEGEEPLGTGELVIIDLDQIYREEEFMMSIESDRVESQMFFESTYESRYQKEKILEMISQIRSQKDEERAV